MVLPRLESLRSVRRQAARIDRRVEGTIQEGRVVSIDPTYSPALVNVDLYARTGASATVPAQLVGDYDADSPRVLASRLVGRDVLLLAPSGRPGQRLYVLGLKSTPALLDNTGNDVTGYAEQAARPAMPDLEAFDVEIVSDRADHQRTLRIRTITLALAGTPSRCAVRVNLTAGPVSQTYESAVVFTQGAAQDLDYMGAAEGLPTVTVSPLAGALPLSVPVPAGQSMCLNVVSDISGTLALREGAYHVALTSTPDALSQGLVFDSQPPLPVLRIHGSLR